MVLKMRILQLQTGSKLPKMAQNGEYHYIITSLFFNEFLS